MATIGDNVAALRRQVPMTQEQLAEASGVAAVTIRKLETNERTTARMATLSALARALGVTTSRLLGDASSAAARREPTAAPLALLDIRRALTPVRGLDGELIAASAEAEPPTAGQVRESLRAASRLYHTNDYGAGLSVLPGLLAEARAAVEVDDDEAQAYALLSQAYQLAGRLLIQFRAVDLAYTAVAASRDAAARSGSDVIAAAVVGPMCWLLLRQARLGEAEQLAVHAADQVEPTRISRAGTDHVAAWGWLLVEASAAVMRDGRDGDAQEMLDLAETAATRISNHPPTGLSMIDGFGPGKVAALRTEAAAVAGDPRRVLTLAERLPVDDRRMTASCYQRHRLDVAWAHTELGDYAQATAVLTDLRDRAPAWLRQQRYARDIVRSISAGRRRAMTEELAELARLVGAAE
ncbi:helix-turn-helix transcriptional regulator [Micromonospora sp. NPDC049559]|uniref:helix-turn-helix domain-containing protein n=1 Tax=Micromonospora sp. NPDC049559 TaxID=3155923 RepID=UPI0034173AC1